MLEHKADINQADGIGTTPFMMAVYGKHHIITNLLLKEPNLHTQDELAKIEKEITYATEAKESSHAAYLNTIKNLLESAIKNRAEAETETNKATAYQATLFSKTSQSPKSAETKISASQDSAQSEVPTNVSATEQKAAPSSDADAKKDKKPHPIQFRKSGT